VLPDGRTAYRIHFLQDDPSAIPQSLVDHRQPPPPPGYRMPEAGGAILRDIASASPRAGYAVLGHSVLGHPIEAIWLGQAPESGAPVFRILGGHHGDEWSSFEVPLSLAERLAEGDGIDAQITAILDQSTVWITPYVNPDGILEGSRYNANFVDLNRNYDFAWNPEEFLPGDAPFSEPETRAIRATSHYDLPMAGLSFHSGATNIGYVWNHTPEPAPDQALAEALAEDYASLTGNLDFWVTNGAAWYITAGDTNDWSYGRYGVLDFTVEVTEDKTPPVEQLEGVIAGQMSATLAFLSEQPTLSGHIVDADTKRPVLAKITVDHSEVSFYSDPVRGSFHRLVPEASVTLTVQADGYEPVTDVFDLPDQDLTLALKRTAVTPPHWPVLTRPTRIQIPNVSTGILQLTRPGSAPAAVIVSQSQATVDTDQLAEGAWTLQSTEQTWIRSILVAHRILDAPVFEGKELVFADAFEPGSRAWAIHGPDRALTPLAILDEGPTHLRLDGSTLDRSVRTDVMVLSGGRHLARTDIFQTPERSHAMEGDIIVGVPVGCSCATGGRHRSGALLSILLVFLLRRRFS